MEDSSSLLNPLPDTAKRQGDDKQVLLQQEIEQNVRALKDARELYDRMSTYVNRTFLNVEQWSKQELMEWFFQQGKPEYAALTSHNQLDGRALLCLTWEDCVMRLGLLLTQAFAFYDYVKLLQVSYYQPLMLVAPAKQIKHRIDLYERYFALAQRLKPSPFDMVVDETKAEQQQSVEVRTPPNEAAPVTQSMQAEEFRFKLPNGIPNDRNRPAVTEVAQPTLELMQL